MKKLLTMFVALLMATMSANAQTEDNSAWTLNTRAWCTNYFTSAIYSIAAAVVKEYIFDGKDSLTADRIIPSASMVFPVGMGKKGFDDPYDIYGPYHRAFGNPIKHIGDYAVGFDVSYKPGFVGCYVGTYFKSQEVVFKETDDNIRGFYIQPRAGFILGKGKRAFEAGVFYDVLTGCGGSVSNPEKDQLKGGLGLDFAFSRTVGKNQLLLQFSMPLHNFFNTDYAGQKDLKRKVGYIMLTRRISL